jgi:hypothetical protein
MVLCCCVAERLTLLVLDLRSLEAVRRRHRFRPNRKKSSLENTRFRLCPAVDSEREVGPLEGPAERYRRIKVGPKWALLRFSADAASSSTGTVREKPNKSLPTTRDDRHLHVHRAAYPKLGRNGGLLPRIRDHMRDNTTSRCRRRRLNFLQQRSRSHVAHGQE